jgi:hypothetical protein
VDILAAQGAPPISLAPVANGKYLQSQKFLFGRLWVVEQNLPLGSLTKMVCTLTCKYLREFSKKN